MTAPDFKSLRGDGDGLDLSRMSSKEVAAELTRRSLALRAATAPARRQEPTPPERANPDLAGPDHDRLDRDPADRGRPQRPRLDHDLNADADGGSYGGLPPTGMPPGTAVDPAPRAPAARAQALPQQSPHPIALYARGH